MALKKVKSVPRVFDDPVLRSERLEVCRDRIWRINEKITELNKEKSDLKNEVAEIELYPFKPGDVVFCNLKSGRTAKETKCLIEVGGDGDVYVRPYKKDGGLSDRRFSVLMNMALGMKYTEFFKRCDQC